MSNWLVTGAAGHPGRDLVQAPAAGTDIDLVATVRSERDITGSAAVRAAVAGRDLVVVLGQQARGRAGLAPLRHVRPVLADALRRPRFAELRGGTW